jgi:hypothetical protein
MIKKTFVCVLYQIVRRSFVTFSFWRKCIIVQVENQVCVLHRRCFKEFKLNQFNAFTVFRCNAICTNSILQDENEHLNLGKCFNKKRDYLRTHEDKTRFEPIPNWSYFPDIFLQNISDEKRYDMAVGKRKRV